MSLPKLGQATQFHLGIGDALIAPRLLTGDVSRVQHVLCHCPT